jgi:hypothetical protein
MTQAAELKAGLPRCFLTRQSRSNMPLHLLLKMKSQFLIKLVFNSTPPE